MQNPETFLQQLLQSHSPDVQARVLQVVKTMGIAESDPIFLLLIATATVQVMIEDTPDHLKQTYRVCHQQVMADIKDYEKAAVKGVEMRLADAVQDVIRKAKASEKEPGWQVFGFFGVITLLVMLVGVWAGRGISEAERVSFRQQGKLSLEEAQSLDWAMSPEGQYARQLLFWNDSLMGGECQAQVKRLDVRLRYGSLTARNGFCFLWVVPPDKREFQ
jgi:hypothetical protein